MPGASPLQVEGVEHLLDRDRFDGRLCHRVIDRSDWRIGIAPIPTEGRDQFFFVSFSTSARTRR